MPEDKQPTATEIQYTLDKAREEKLRERRERAKRKREHEMLARLVADYFMESVDHKLTDSLISILSWSERRSG